MFEFSFDNCENDILSSDWLLVDFPMEIGDLVIGNEESCEL